MDISLTMCGLALLAFSIAMLVYYLKREKGTIFDPISVSWIGYAFWIGIGVMAAAGAASEFSQGTRLKALMLLFAGTAAFTIGLYSGSGQRLGRILPRPAASLGPVARWGLWVVGGVGAFVVLPFMGVRFWEGGPLVSLLASAGFAMALVSIHLITSFSGHILGKVVMGVSLVAYLAMISTTWSRRHLPGLVLAVFAGLYVAKSKKWSKLRRRLLAFTAITIGLFMLLFLTQTRAHDPSRPIGERLQGWSVVAGFQGLWRNAAGNYHYYEFVVDQFPEQEKFLGTGMVPGVAFFIPRSLWKSKPVPTGTVVGRRYWRVRNVKSSVAYYIVGETYANFGEIGCLVAMFVIGHLVRVVNRHVCINRHNHVLWTAWLAVTPEWATQWRGDFTSMTAQGLIKIAVFLFIGWLAAKIMGRRDLTPAETSRHDVFSDAMSVDGASRGDGMQGMVE